jgi:hypothetical protein
LQALCARALRFRKDFAASVRSFADAHGAAGEIAGTPLAADGSDPAEVEASAIISQVRT